MEKKFRKVRELVDRSQNILLLLHLNPDGDTVSSALALAAYFRRIGKSADCAVKEEIPEIFHFLPGIADIKKDFLLGDYDLVFAVDCGDAARTGFPLRLEQISKLKPLINIDHHFRNNLHKIARLNIVDEKASAAAEIVWEFLKFSGAELDSKIATYVLAGIYYDTGGFQHSNVTDKTLRIASECLRLGGRIALISQKINGTKSSAALRLWGIALRRMLIKKNGIVSSFLTRDDLHKNGAKAEDASGIVNLLNTVENSKVAILFLENSDGTIKASLRGESDKIDVSALARIFGGGGHKKAAGFTIKGRLVKTLSGMKIAS